MRPNGGAFVLDAKFQDGGNTKVAVDSAAEEGVPLSGERSLGWPQWILGKGRVW